jgi:hypothetical protein
MDRPIHRAVVHDPRRMEVVDDAMAAVLRRKTEAERLGIAFGMWAFARDMIARRVRSDCPDLTEEQVGQIVAGRMSHGAW